MKKILYIYIRLILYILVALVGYIGYLFIGVWLVSWSEKEFEALTIHRSIMSVDDNKYKESGRGESNINNARVWDTTYYYKADREADWVFSHKNGQEAFINIYDSSNVYLIDKPQGISAISLSPEHYVFNEIKDMYILGFATGEVILYDFKQEDPILQVIDIKKTVLNITWVNHQIAVLGLDESSNEGMIDVYWYSFDEDTSVWNISHVVSTNIAIETLDGVYVLEDKGIFIFSRGELFLLAHSSSEITQLYSDVMLQNIQGNKHFFVVQYLRDKKMVLDIILDDSLLFSLDRIIQTTDISLVSEAVHNDVVLHSVSSEDNNYRVQIKDNNLLYTLELP